MCKLAAFYCNNNIIKYLVFTDFADLKKNWDRY